jgi:hypothetical protein
MKVFGISSFSPVFRVADHPTTNASSSCHLCAGKRGISTSFIQASRCRLPSQCRSKRRSRFVHHPDFNPEFDQLLDGSGEPSWLSQRPTLELSRAETSSSRRAFVARNPAYFGIGRMAETYNSLSERPSQIQVFLRFAFCVGVARTRRKRH